MVKGTNVHLFGRSRRERVWVEQRGGDAGRPEHSCDVQFLPRQGDFGTGTVRPGGYSGKLQSLANAGNAANAANADGRLPFYD